MIVLYSNDCPKCRILKKKLDENSVSYELKNEFDRIIEMGFINAPVLQIDDKFLDFKQANDWIKERV